jgi:hypothetical protein
VDALERPAETNLMRLKRKFESKIFWWHHLEQFRAAYTHLDLEVPNILLPSDIQTKILCASQPSNYL